MNSISFSLKTIHLKSEFLPNSTTNNPVGLPGETDRVGGGSYLILLIKGEVLTF